MELRPPLIALIIDVCILCLSGFAIISLITKERQHNLWAIIFLLGFFMQAFSKVIGPHAFNLLRSPFLNTPSWHFIIMPALYLYARYILGYKNKVHPVWHFLPFFFFYLLFLFAGPILPQPRGKGGMTIPRGFFPKLVGRGFVISIVSIFAIYLVATWGLLRKHTKEYKNYYAQSDHYTSLRWIKWLLMIVLLSVILIFFTRVGIGLDQYQFFKSNFWLINLGAFIITAVFSFFTINQFLLYRDFSKEKSLMPSLNLQETLMAKTIDDQLHTTSIELDQSKIIVLEKYMIQEQPYLQPKIKIADLAAELDKKPHTLSKLINEHYGYNFFYFINKYRVEHAVNLMKEENSQSYTLEGIGNLSGFNSRATFNARFKEIKGMTPGEFRKQIK